MTDQTLSIDSLLRLDPARPDEAVRLRIGILKLAGWRVEQKSDGYRYLIRPGGDAKPFENYGAEYSAWAHAPHVESSLDAALTLPIDEGAEWEIHVLSSGKSIARIPITVSSNLRLAEPPFQEADQPAWAACRAWLAYRRRESARQRAGEA